jgi:hypothetical protein
LGAFEITGNFQGNDESSFSTKSSKNQTLSENTTTFTLGMNKRNQALASFYLDFILTQYPERSANIRKFMLISKSG